MATVDVDIRKLLEAGAHFGHKTSRWHPKMAQFIHSKRGGSHIIDLTKTVEGLNNALDFITETVAAGKPVLLVSTKRQAADLVRKTADDTKMPFVTERWLGGMITNWPTISGRIKRLKDLESKMSTGELANKYNKLEIQRFQEEIDSLTLLYGGIKDMPQRPGAIFIIDITHDVNAVREARKLNVPIVALVDTNADPTHADYPIPCNDDAIKTIELVLDYVKQAIEAGKAKAQKNDEKAEPAKDKTE
jgi:small subunit ribosomal protein S2